MTRAYIFPGQGSQKPGMLEPFLASPLTKQYFDRASQIVGYDMFELVTQGTAEELKPTAKAQPIILTTSYLAYQIFRAAHPDLEPALVAGHSLGEYTALLAAEVFSFEDAVYMVHRRGNLMQNCCPTGLGAMAAILGKDAKEVEELCKLCREQETLSPANFNCPGQIVVAGHKNAVERLLKKAKGVLLEVSVPFHCSLLEPMQQEMATVIQKVAFSPAKWPVVSNAKNLLLQDPQAIQQSLVEQITAPVLWQTGIERMIEKGVTEFLEFGSGNVLCNLNKRITNLPSTPINSVQAAAAYQPN